MTCGLAVCACGANIGALGGGDGIARLDSGAELARDAGVTTQADAGKPPPDSGVTARDAGVGTSADAGSPPPTCGNSTLEMGEACDGAALNGNTCSSLPGFTTGFLKCAANCLAFDVSQCTAGSTRAAATCSKTDVTAAINAASDGDIVTVPAGTCSWGAFTLAKGVVLRGAGKASTIISLSTLSASGSAARAFRLTGMTIKGGNPSIEITGEWKNFRIDHSVITSSSWVTGILVSFSSANGVIDNDEFFNSRTEVYGEGNGSPAWSRPSSIGMGDAVFLESSTSDWAVYGNAIDSTAGGRYVIRHNTIYNTPIENHGACTSGMRGTRSYEIYENTLVADTRGTMAGITYRPMLLRGGTGVVFNNTIAGPWSTKTIHIDSQRSCVEYISDLNGACGGLWSSHPQCDGKSGTLYDGPLSAQGYPCRDQLGRSTDQGITTVQALEPLYAWNNKAGSQAVPVVMNPAVDCTMTPVHLKEDRDYVLETPRPGYVPYPYPHPLTLID